MALVAAASAVLVASVAPAVLVVPAGPVAAV